MLVIPLVIIHLCGGVFKKYIGFEPDYKNYTALKARVERLKNEWNKSDQDFEILNLGVGKENSTYTLEIDSLNDGLGSRINKDKNEQAPLHGNNSIEIVSLDSYLKDKIDFLKADIEGFEFDLLQGCVETIKSYKPNLAICIYHNVFDMFRIQQYVKSLVKEYNFEIRHYSRSFGETVLYCWCDTKE